MACPTDGRYNADLFQQAMEDFDLWEAMFCVYGGPMGELVVGTIVYSAFALAIFVRTGSLIIPFVMLLVLGGTVLSQMLGVIGSFAGLIILVVAPLVVTALIVAVDRR